jgi:hypothetical protein
MGLALETFGSGRDAGLPGAPRADPYLWGVNGYGESIAVWGLVVGVSGPPYSP